MAYEYNETNKRYHSLDYYLKSKFNKKVFKVPLNASFTCPNRDGTKGLGGCTFCSAKGSGDFAGNPQKPLMEQFQDVMEILHNKWNDAYYIVYFQAFTNTYAPVSKLKETFEPFIGKEKVVGMSIATRPDCINKEIVDYLKELSTHFEEFWVELGLQTIYEKTARKINRCYSYDEFENAVKLLNEANIKIIVHIIDGLPGEDTKMMVNTIKRLNKLPIFGIKIHMLNILENTILGNEYKKKKFHLLSEEEFIDIAILQLQHLKGNVIIHRLGGDSDAKNLIAPQWVLKKLTVIDKIDKKMEEMDAFQGEKFE